MGDVANTRVAIDKSELTLKEMGTENKKRS